MKGSLWLATVGLFFALALSVPTLALASPEATVMTTSRVTVIPVAIVYDDDECSDSDNDGNCDSTSTED